MIGLGRYSTYAASAITQSVGDKEYDIFYVGNERRIAIIAQCYFVAT
jgi:hypothetical protein